MGILSQRCLNKLTTLGEIESQVKRKKNVSLDLFGVVIKKTFYSLLVRLSYLV